jgi:hypothetical protein
LEGLIEMSLFSDGACLRPSFAPIGAPASSNGASVFSLTLFSRPKQEATNKNQKIESHFSRD